MVTGNLIILYSILSSSVTWYLLSFPFFSFFLSWFWFSLTGKSPPPLLKKFNSYFYLLLDSVIILWLHNLIAAFLTQRVEHVLLNTPGLVCILFVLMWHLVLNCSTPKTPTGIGCGREIDAQMEKEERNLGPGLASNLVSGQFSWMRSFWQWDSERVMRSLKSGARVQCRISHFIINAG